MLPQAELDFGILHQFGDKAYIGRYTGPPIRYERVGRLECPCVGVDEVGDDDGDRAGFAGFAVYIGRRVAEPRVVWQVSFLLFTLWRYAVVADELK